jgi:quinol monooxygenase YgiN
MTGRRPVLAGLALAMLGGPAFAKEIGRVDELFPTYGLIGKMKAKPGMGPELVKILTAGTSEMPGCMAYLVAQEAKDSDAIWITELWDSKESHAASLKLPSVQDAIAKGRPMIAGFELSVETVPVINTARD